MKVANRTPALRAVVTNSVFRIRRIGDDGRLQTLAQGETDKLYHQFLAGVELSAFAPGQEEQERVCFDSKPKAKGRSDPQKLSEASRRRDGISFASATNKWRAR